MMAACVCGWAQAQDNLVDRVSRAVGVRLPDGYEAKVKEFVTKSELFQRKSAEAFTEQWIENKDDDFYNQAASVFRGCIEKEKDLMENLSILKPYAFVLEDEDRDSVAELYVVDDDTVIIDTELMKDLDKDLDDFFENLLKS